VVTTSHSGHTLKASAKLANMTLVLKHIQALECIGLLHGRHEGPAGNTSDHLVARKMYWADTSVLHDSQCVQISHWVFYSKLLQHSLK